MSKIKKIVQSYSQAVQLLVLVAVIASALISPLVYAAGEYQFIATSNGSNDVSVTSSSLSVEVKSYNQAYGTIDVSGTVAYPSSKLYVKGFSQNSTDFNLNINNTGNGKIAFSGKSKSSVSSVNTMFTINFGVQKYYQKTTAIVNFTGGNTINEQTALTKQLTVHLNNPQKATPKPTTTPKPSTTPKPIQTTAPKESTKPTPSPDPTPPASEPDLTGVISNVNVTPSYTSSKIEFTINSKKPSPQFNFSESYTSKYKLLPIEQSSKSTYSVSIPSLIPGHTYYYMIVDVTGDNKASYSDSFLTPGYPINIEVKENGKPVQSAQAQINSQTYPVQNGVLSLGLAAGTYEGTVTSSSASTPIKFTVKDVDIPTDGSDPETQKFSVALSSNVLEGGPGATTTIFQFIGVLAGGIALLTVGFLVFMSIRRKKLENNSYSSQQSSSVVIDDGYNWDQHK